MLFFISAFSSLPLSFSRSFSLSSTAVAQCTEITGKKFISTLGLSAPLRLAIVAYHFQRRPIRARDCSFGVLCASLQALARRASNAPIARRQNPTKLHLFMIILLHDSNSHERWRKEMRMRTILHRTSVYDFNSHTILFLRVRLIGIHSTNTSRLVVS